ncbi:MAG: DUF349 domain-containing protein [Bacteroides sp.]|nr:DUF349 domain-containing protein [Bacteroides sp.]
MTNAQDTNLPLNTDDKEKDKVEVSEVAKEEQTTSVVENKEETEAKEKESVKDTTPESSAKEQPKEGGETPTKEEVTQTEETQSPKAEEDSKKEEAESKKGILQQLKELGKDVINTNRQELESLKQAFYKLHNEEIEEAKKAFKEKEGKDSTKPFSFPKDELEEEFKKTFELIRAKRKEAAVEIEKIKEENLAKKEAIIERLKEMVETPDDANTLYKEFKSLEKQWNEIKQVPQGKVKELWKSYDEYVEQFYDVLKLSNEFRDYDFKKNLEIKTRLCEIAEKLIEEPDIVSAFHQLQKLHDEYRETGPVAKELRDEVWDRFKAASTEINKRHQKHFENLKKEEEYNLEQKTTICEIVESINYDELNSFRTWNSKTKEVIALQARWKTIGFVPKKMNTKIFDRFSKACDEFFNQKSEFFADAKKEMEENLKKKEALCEKAEALKESTDWKRTSDILIQVQKDWKKIGPVHRKYSNAIWRRFIAACDYFFEQRNKANDKRREKEEDNLKEKRALIEKLESITAEDDAKKVEDTLHESMNEWKRIGHVPYRLKDKLHEEFYGLVDSLFEKFKLSRSAKRLESFVTNVDNIQKEGNDRALYKERERLMYTRDRMKNDLIQYETNLSFFSSTTKKGNNLVDEMNKKASKLQADIKLIEKKIQVLEQSLLDNENAE